MNSPLKRNHMKRGQFHKILEMQIETTGTRQTLTDGEGMEKREYSSPDAGNMC